jgi:hypothetical protein
LKLIEPFSDFFPLSTLPSIHNRIFFFVVSDRPLLRSLPLRFLDAAPGQRLSAFLDAFCVRLQCGLQRCDPIPLQRPRSPAASSPAGAKSIHWLRSLTRSGPPPTVYRGPTSPLSGANLHSLPSAT